MTKRDKVIVRQTSRTILAGTVLLGLSLICAVRAQAAPLVFSEDSYRQLVDAGSSDTIPPGTRITLENWRQYRNFMPIWLQGAFNGNSGIHVGSGPEYAMVVGATVHYPMPGRWKQDAEKYGNQAALIRQPNGGYVMKGWVAGPPFPNPHGPTMAVQILYNAWAPFRPFILHSASNGTLVDRFGNRTTQDTNNAFYMLSHLSEPGMPINMPYANGFFYVSRFMVVAPEQSKYTTELSMQPDDPTRLPELYVFLPSLRRSLRLSSAARCSPILGTDSVNDDNAWNPNNFKVTLLGEKKLLMPIMDPARAHQADSYVGFTGGAAGTFPGWPKPEVTRWQVRPFYVLHLQWLPQLGPYCFAHRIFYVDKETWMPPFTENWDNENKLWKGLWEIYAPINFRGEQTIMLDGYAGAHQIDWENGHISASYAAPPTTDDDVPADFKDAQTMTTPGGLSRIMK